MKHIDDILRCLVLQYTYFTDTENENLWYTTKQKFEEDLTTLLDAGYTCLSFEEASLCRSGKRDWPEKSFCVAFFGGYQNNYDLAFPILQELSVKASIFVDVCSIEKNSFSNYLTWSSIQTMVDSGFVSIFPLWFESDEHKKFCDEIHNRVRIIQSHIKNNNANFAVGFNTREAICFSSEFIRNCGFFAHNIYRYDLTDNDISQGAFLTFRVDMDAEVLGTIALVSSVCKQQYHDNETEVKSEERYIAPLESSLEQSIELPIVQKPIVKNYLRHATPLSVIQAHNAEKAEIYALTECIEVTFKPWDMLFDYHNYSYEYWDMIIYKKITRDILNINSFNVVEYVINALKLGYYSDVWLDAFYIPSKAEFRVKHVTHGVLIYGFDSSCRAFKAISYTPSGKYEPFAIDIELFSLACNNKYFIYLNLIKYNYEDNSYYDVNNILSGLKDYITSRVFDDNKRFVKKSANQYYNYKACLKFSETFSEIVQKRKQVPLVMIYSYCEHKQLMAWRLSIIAKKTHLQDEHLYNNCANIEQLSKRIMNLSLKYNMTLSDRLIDAIIFTIDKVNKIEKESVERLLEQSGYNSH